MADTAPTSQGSFARSTGLPGYMGKADNKLSCMLPDMPFDDFTRLANSLGLPVSELLRDWVMRGLYGGEQVRRMHEQRLSMLERIGQEFGQAPAQPPQVVES